MGKRKKRNWEDQIAYNNAMDVKRMNPLLQRICVHTDHPDYEAAVDAIFEEIKRANARERPAYMAGYNMGYVTGEDGSEDDMEQAWQQYRCQDDTDWKAVDDETAAAIDASVFQTVQDSK